jgi:hypothetical protein
MPEMPEQQTASQTPAPQEGPAIPPPSEVVADVKKAMPAERQGNYHKSLLLVAALVILTGILLVLSFAVKKSSSPAPAITKEETPVNFAQTKLAVSDSPRVASTSGSYETDVNIDSGENKITGAELILTYDPKILSNVDIKTGSFLPSSTVISKQIDTAEGKITFIFGTAQGAKGVQGSGQLAVISFTKTGSGAAEIDFSPDTLISAEGYDSSVLSEMNSASFDL